MSQLFYNLSNIDNAKHHDKKKIVDTITEHIKNSEYELIEVDDQRPWGAYFKFDNKNSDLFIKEFFSHLDPADIRLGEKHAELSPKILLVNPNHRLSWQYHNRRSEKWLFLTDGGYHNSFNDELSELQKANVGNLIEFQSNERHRLVGGDDYTIVAEVWAHTDNEQLSDEDDIVRLHDDFGR